MKVLLLSPAMFGREGGIERLMRLYLKALGEICEQEAGTVESLCLSDGRGGTGPGLLTAYSGKSLRQHRGFAHNKLRFALAVLRRARGSDLIVCGHINQLIVARVARLLNRKLRYCVVAHGIEVWRPYGLLERWALRGADRIFCVSEFTRGQMLRFDKRLTPSRLKVVPNALDPQLAGKDSGAGHNPPAAQRRPTILSVGRLTRSDSYKGFDTLIEAMPAVLGEYTEARLRIVGTGDDLPRLRALAAECGVAHAVHFLSRVGDEALRAEYAECSVFALPSRSEGFGLVYLEALTQGKPCIGAKAGAALEVIGETGGLCVGYGNVAELTAAIVELQRHPPEAVALRDRAQEFSFERFHERLAEALPR
ncbi:hypothetical protein AXK12_00285 [Cephaloticoccus capnophilus]|uniref:Glycosyltransferase subfamily 4-like N-terminal domain-containing protein n=1 Tax=Cephaloticoccus capnophilus TaxID=1548208 RepID=A0A139SKI9_9BACT|nr:glycosyltransferase family 4 protein [Cephaloticoccus capnophilus]KXU35040.1 hypothetical protein AXK12_00285 [Cephaloticoccus capnophilus]